jgi:phosphoribosylglycinamide formyltransferase-1
LTTPVVVLISGNGSNLQALIDASSKTDAPFHVEAVISNKEDAYGLQRAARAGIETQVVRQGEHDDREQYDQALSAAIDAYNPGLIALAGFMRILTNDFVRRYRGRLLNIHPSLLPKHKGLNTHQKAIEAGDLLHGASVHFVTEELDGGPVIMQAQVGVQAGDTPDRLAVRVLEKEHIIYPLTVKWFAEKRLGMNDNRVILDGHPLAAPVIFDFC